MPLDATFVDRLYRRAGAAKWRVPRETFAEALERAAQRGADLSTLHLDDLALACGCAAGDEAAWEHFIREHRPVLYRAADALDATGGARELADDIYGELFARSLFSYFHGRSSLATWLRAVLSQRYVDRVRVTKRLQQLPEDEDRPAPSIPVGRSAIGDTTSAFNSFEETHQQQRCREVIEQALTDATSELAPRDRLRLACYYAQGLTLAETGKLLGEHEASCSRHLARTRKTLRGTIERRLKDEHSLTDGEIADCFSSVSQDAGELDLRQLLRIEERKESPEDRSTVRGRT
ncbi:MAG TPA: sigma-70 family RNA polymerase sigma factor [Burkholderiales bacterium]|nr:sigma-70 family RNA polymerase sigma factor [Burkholderiales bacterium]